MAESDKIQRLTDDITELKALAERATRSRVQDILSVEIRKLETLLLKEKESAGPAKEDSAPKAASAAAATKAYDVAIKNYSWDQSDNFVKIYLTGLAGVQGIPEERVTKWFGPRSVEVKVEDLAGKNPTFSIKELCEEIDPDRSYVKVKTDMVSVFLCKKKSGSKWSGLRPAEKPKGPKVDADVGKDGDPSAGLMNLMKQMYEDGDDEMKRTIAKAWTESRDKKTDLNL